MPSTYTHDVVATTGEYTDRQGEKKKNYTKVGAAFTDDQGRISIKLDCIPVTPDWSGWLSLYPPKDKQEQTGQQQAPRQQQRDYQVNRSQPRQNEGRAGGVNQQPRTQQQDSRFADDSDGSEIPF